MNLIQIQIKEIFSSLAVIVKPGIVLENIYFKSKPKLLWHI